MEEINQPLTRQCKPDKISQLECWSCPRACLDPLTGSLTAVAAQQDDTAVVQVPAGVVTAGGSEAVGLRPPARPGEQLTAGLSSPLVAATGQEAGLSVAVSAGGQWRQGTAPVGFRQEDLRCSHVGVTPCDQNTCKPASIHLLKLITIILTCPHFHIRVYLPKGN